MPPFASATTWMRLTFRWSNSTQTWQERIGDLVLVGGLVVAAAISWFVSMAWWQILLVWCLCLLPALILGRAGWLKVFGPVLYYDMIRQARRNRFSILRCLYALLLVFLLFCVANGTRGSLSGPDAHHRAAEIAQTYFDVFMVAQFITVVLLTPAYVAGAIAEEKDRKTLEFMLATDLLNREIVLSKLGSRVANLALVVLTGLPILSILQFLGGVDPNLVVAGFVVTAMTIAGQAGVSILSSVTCKKPRDAISLAYLAVIMYYFVAFLLMTVPALLGAGTWAGPAIQFCVDVLNKGNLIMLVAAVTRAGYAGSLATSLPELVRDYSLFHGCVALLCTGLAIARVRRVALIQTYGTAQKSGKRARIWNRPAVGSKPMLWKELYCEGQSRRTWLGWIIMTLLLAATFVPAMVIVWDQWDTAFAQPVSRWNSLSEHMNGWVRTCNVAVGCLTLLAVGVRASTSITTERDKETFDTLLTTPLDSGDILYAKWLGSLFGVRFGMLWMAAIWAVGVVTGGLHFAALVLVAVAWLVYAAFASALGLWFSVVCKTSLKATGCTIAAMIALSVLHWLPWMCCVFAMAGGGRGIEYVAKFQACVLTPPFVLGVLPCSTQQTFDLARHMDKEAAELLGFCVVGFFVWSIGAFIVYSATSARFKHITHRVDLVQLSHSLDQHSYSGWQDEGHRSRQQHTGAPMSPWAPPTGQVSEESGIFDPETVEPTDDPDDQRRSS